MSTRLLVESQMRVVEGERRVGESLVRMRPNRHLELTPLILSFDACLSISRPQGDLPASYSLGQEEPSVAHVHGASLLNLSGPTLPTVLTYILRLPLTSLSNSV